VADKLTKLNADLSTHFDKEKDPKCKSTLQMLNSNIECIKEDLDTWSAMDSASWLTVINGDGICKEA